MAYTVYTKTGTDAAIAAQATTDASLYSPLTTFPIGARAAGETDDTAAIQRAITSAATFGAGRVEGQPGKTYQVTAPNSKTVLFPSGGSASISYALSLPSNVTVDMRGSTIQLQGSTAAALIVNASATGAARDSNIGLVNVILDGRSLVSSTTSVMQLCYIDGLTLSNVKIINGYNQGGWIYAVTGGHFDLLDSDGFHGQPWTFGDPQTGGHANNQVYDSTFGLLLGKNVSYLASPSQPGNPYDFVLTRCTIETIQVQNCGAGIKLQEPSTDVTVGMVLLDTCGEATVLNSGFKIQGNPASAAGVDRPTRINVGLVIAKNQANIGLYMFHCQDCHVGAYYGYNNTTLHTASSDVLLAGGINSHVGYIHSRNSNGGGVRVSSDGTNVETGFRIDTIKVFNPGQNASSAIKQGLRVDAAVTAGSFGRVEVIDDQATHTMDLGFYNNNATAAATFDYFSASGYTSSAFSSSSAALVLPAPVISVAGRTGVVALTKTDVGLANVDNTSDVNKPVSTAQQTALNLKAPLASPAFTGTPTAPTATAGTNTTQVASTAFVTSAVASAGTGSSAASYWAPTGAIAETCTRFERIAAIPFTSGRIALSGGILVPAGRTVTSITFVCANGAGAGFSNQWFCIVDQSMNVLAKTTDDTTTAWAANASKTLNLTSPWTPSVATPVYLGLVVAATTMPTMEGAEAAASGSGAAGLTPFVAANVTSSLTTPASLGSTVTGTPSIANMMYAYIS